MTFILSIIALVIIGPVLFVAIEEWCASNLRAYEKRAVAKKELKQEELRCIKLMAEYQELLNEQERLQGGGQFLPTRTDRRRR